MIILSLILALNVLDRLRFAFLSVIFFVCESVRRQVASHLNRIKDISAVTEDLVYFF
jgi:hypothetical protein